MSNAIEFRTYCQQGGTENFEQYNQRLDRLKAEIGCFVSDHKNLTADIGARIFGQLDLSSKIAFSQTSKLCYKRSQKEWFEQDCREIVLKYIQQGTSLKDYFLEGGWQEGLLVAFKVAGVALTVCSAIKSSQHAANIPEDAPKKTKIVTDPDTFENYEITYIDHPEAYKAAAWEFCALTSGIVTSTLIAHGITQILEGIDINVFFSQAERDIIQDETNFFTKCTLPGFRDWKLTRMRNQLSSNPDNWNQNPALSAMLCPISNDFMLFPVKDSCGHHYDYRSLRAHQITHHLDPFTCPLSPHPNNGLLMVTFDKSMFDFVQRKLLNPLISSSSDASSLSSDSPADLSDSDSS